jgi:hypothetical protein
MVIKIPKYGNVKTRLCQDWRKGLGTDQNPEDSSKTVFTEDVLRLASNFSFLRTDHSDDSGKIIFVFGWKDCEYLL